MQITQFDISSDRTQIDLIITDAATISALRFWTDDNYKDYSKAIDLSALLTASATENITITLSDVGLAYFDGVYFIEAEDPDEISNAIVADLTRYKECILGKLKQFPICDDCLQTKNDSKLTAHAILLGLEYAVELGFINQILSFVSALDKYCSDDCTLCGEKNNVIDTNYYSSND